MPILSFFLFLFVCAATWLRLHYGIDFTDESYYIVMPLRFIRGDHPFVDELFINQTAALIAMPFVKIFYLLKGSTEGIVLYMRTVFLLLSMAVSLLSFRFFKNFLKTELALILAAAQVAIIPLNIPGMSYNSLGALCLTAMLFTRHPFVAALWGGLASVAYPTLAIPGLTYLFYLIVLSKERFKSALQIFGAVVVITLSFLPFFLRAGNALADSFLYSLTSFDHGGGYAKLKLVLSHILVANVSIPMRWTFLLVLLSQFIPIKQRWRSSMFLAIPLLVYFSYSSAMYTQIWFVFYFSFLAPLFFLSAPERKPLENLLYGVWLPSVLAGLCISWTSSSSAINGVLGLTPAFLVSLFFVIKNSEYYFSKRQLVYLPGMITLGILVYTQFTGKAFYRDRDFVSLTRKIPSGPYQGLYTSPDKFKYLEQITADIKKVENKKGKIVFYEFPAGYLISQMRPGVNSTWIRDISRGKKFYAKYYESHLDPNNIVFEVDWLCHEQERMQKVRYSSEDPLNLFIQGTHHLILSRPDYRVFSAQSNVSAGG